MVFPVIFHGSESWTLKKHNGKSVGAFEIRCWRRLLRRPWTAKKTKMDHQTHQFKVLAQGRMTRVKLSYLGHIRRKPTFLEKV